VLLLGENIYIIKKNTEAVLGASNEVGLEVKVEYTFTSHHQTTLQNHSVKVVLLKCDKVQIFGNDSNKSKLQAQLGNVCFHAVQIFGFPVCYLKP
jgi:hypothetical protein